MTRKSKVPSANQTSRPRRLFLEALETRNLLAGNVTAFVAGGTLFIRGDNSGNGVIVSEVGPNEYSVTGFDQDGSGTRIKNNGNGNGPVNNTLVFSGVTVNIDIALKNGNDAVAVGNDASELNSLFIDCFDELIVPDEQLPEEEVSVNAVFPGTLEVPFDLIINTGDGHDEVAVVAEARDGVILTGNQDDLVAVGSSFFSDDLIIDTGKGFDGVCVVNTTVNDLLSIATGNDSDGVDVFDVFAGSIVVVTGAGFDGVSAVGFETAFGVTINVGAGGSAVAVIDFDIGGSLAIVGASGFDDVFVSGGEGDSEIGGALSIVTGDTADFVGVEGLDVGLAAVIATGNGDDNVEVVDLSALALVIDTGNGNDGEPGDGEFPGSPILVSDSFIEFGLTIVTGNGEDLVSVEFTEAQTLVLNTGNHNDEATIFESFIRGDAVVVLGSGHDTFFAELLDVGRNATLDAGAGDDEVTLEGCNVDGLFQAFMGTGNDTLNIFGSTAGRARLFGGENSNDFDELNSDSDDAEVFEFEDVNIV